MRKLRAFALAVIAALAIGAVASASAFAGYRSEIEKTNYSGAQVTQIVFATDIGSVKCTTATFVATEVKGTEKGAKNFTAETLSFQPSFSGCTLAGLKVTFDSKSCLEDYTPNTPTPENKKHFRVDPSCTGGTTTIKDTAGLGCELTVGSQTWGGVEKGNNLGSGSTREIEGVLELTEIAYSWTAACPNAGGKAGSKSNGTRSGTIRLKGTNPSGGAQVGVWVE
jgi:hypothetical protein